MKILIVSQYFWPENFKINELVKFLAIKHDVTVLTSLPNYPKGKIFPKFKKNKNKYKKYYKSKIIRVFQFQRLKGKKINLIMNYLSFLFTAFIKSLFLKKNFDLVITFAPSPIFVGIIGLFIAKMNKSKSFIWVLDLWPEILRELGILKSKFFLKIIDKIANYIYKNHDIVLTQSKSFKKIIQKKIGTKKNKIFYFPSWTDDINFSKKIKRNNKKNLIFLFIGNIGVAQNLNLLIKAVKDTEKIVKQKWIFVGDGRYKKKLIYLINKNNLRNFFEFHSFRPSKNLVNFFKRSDIAFLSLSKGKFLNSTVPGKLQTYMSAGMPILASADGETENIITKSRCGLVSKSNDLTKLSKNIIKFSKISEKTLTKMGENSKKFSKAEFNKKVILNKLENILNY